MQKREDEFIGRFTIGDDPPWPEGHSIDRFRWHGFLHPPTGIGMVVDLQTAEYFSEREPAEEEWAEREGSFWGGSLGGWSNYGRCSLGGSWLVARPDGTKLDFRRLDERTFFVDLPTETASTFVRELAVDTYPRGLSHQDPGTCGNIDEDKSFGIYLLGHDDAHSHNLTFRPLDGNEWALEWNGQVDLTYYWRGTTTFEVKAQGFTFGGIDVPNDFSDAEAWDFLGSTVTRVEDFSLTEVERSDWQRKSFNKRFELMV